MLMQKLFKTIVSFRSNTATIIGFIVVFMLFFSLNLINVPRIFGYAGPTIEPTATPTPPPAPTMRPTTRPTAVPTVEPTIEPTVIPTVTPTIAVVETISLTVDNPLVAKASDLVFRTQFSGFGGVPTLIKLVYSIKDVDGKVAYTENGQVTVNTALVVVKDFKSLNLDDGKYTLYLNTTYGNNIKDEFQKSFEVKGISTTKDNSTSAFWIVFILAILGIGGFMIYRSIKHNPQ